MDEFSDVVASRVSLETAEYFAGGVGVVAETRHVWESGARPPSPAGSPLLTLRRAPRRQRRGRTCGGGGPRAVPMNRRPFPTDNHRGLSLPIVGGFQKALFIPIPQEEAPVFSLVFHFDQVLGHKNSVRITKLIYPD